MLTVSPWLKEVTGSYAVPGPLRQLESCLKLKPGRPTMGMIALEVRDGVTDRVAVRDGTREGVAVREGGGVELGVRVGTEVGVWV